MCQCVIYFVIKGKKNIMLHVLLIVVLVIETVNSFHLKSNFKRINSFQLNSDELDGLKLDPSKLSEKEQERLKFIQKLNNEADDLARAAGFEVPEENYENWEDNEEEKAIIDTQWSGQSGLDVNIKSSNNWNDIIDRPLLAFGDTIALWIFAAIGRASHAENGDIFGTLYTALPFILGWFALSPLLGSYSMKATATRSIPYTATKLLPGWAIGTFGGLLLRGLSKGAAPPTPFIIVTCIATFSLLLLWRFLYIAAFGETNSGEYRKAGFLEVFKMVSTLLKRW